MPISLSTAEEREMTQSLRIVPQSIMPQSAKNGIKGNLNDGNENNASGSGEGGGEEEGGGSEEEGGQTGDVTLSNSAPAPIEITPERTPCGSKETWTGTADVALGVEVPLFWDSPEAAKLFGFSFQNGDNVYKGLTNIVQLLSHAQQSHDGYRRFVANVDRAPLTPTQIFHLRSQC